MKFLMLRCVKIYNEYIISPSEFWWSLFRLRWPGFRQQPSVLILHIVCVIFAPRLSRLWLARRLSNTCLYNIWLKFFVLFALLNLMNNTIMNKAMYHRCDVNTFTCLTYLNTSFVIHCITSYKIFSWISVARGYTPCFLYRLDITGNGAIVHLDKTWTLIEKYNHLKTIKKCSLHARFVSQITNERNDKWPRVSIWEINKYTTNFLSDYFGIVFVSRQIYWNKNDAVGMEMVWTMWIWLYIVDQMPKLLQSNLPLAL